MREVLAICLLVVGIVGPLAYLFDGIDAFIAVACTTAFLLGSASLLAYIFE